MTLFPVVRRELQMASRKPLTYWMRFFAAFWMLVVFLSLLGIVQIGNDPTRFSRAAFYTLSFACLIYAIAAGALHTADAVSWEKREGTFGLLLLTDLHGYDILLGKLVANSLQAVYAMVAVFPIMAVPILLGGVSGLEFWTMVASILATLILSLTVGLCWSTITRETRHNIIGTLMTVLALGIVPWMVSGVMAYLGIPGRWMASEFSFTTPAVLIVKGNPTAVEWVIAKTAIQIQGILALSFLATACWRLRWTGEEEAESTPRFSWFWNPNDPRFITGYRQLKWRDRMERNPYYWLNTVVRLPLFGLKWIVLMAGIVWIIGAVGAVNAPDSQTSHVFVLGLFVVTFATHIWIKVFAALVATRGVSEDRESGALELLLVTAQRDSEIVKGQAMAFRWRFRLPMLVGMVMGLGLALVPLMTQRGLFAMERFLMVICLLLAIQLWADLRLISVVGVQQALRRGNAHQAFRATLVRTLVPSVVIMVFILVTGGFLTALVGLLIWGSVYSAFYRRALVDITRGFRTWASGQEFDTEDWVVRQSFRKALEADLRAAR